MDSSSSNKSRRISAASNRYRTTSQNNNNNARRTSSSAHNRPWAPAEDDAFLQHAVTRSSGTLSSRRHSTESSRLNTSANSILDTTTASNSSYSRYLARIQQSEGERRSSTGSSSSEHHRSIRPNHSQDETEERRPPSVVSQARSQSYSEPTTTSRTKAATTTTAHPARTSVKTLPRRTLNKDPTNTTSSSTTGLPPSSSSRRTVSDSSSKQQPQQQQRYESSSSSSSSQHQRKTTASSSASNAETTSEIASAAATMKQLSSRSEEWLKHVQRVRTPSHERYSTSTKSDTTTDQKLSSSLSQIHHYQAHSPAVEKYLKRSQMMEGIRQQKQQQQNDDAKEKAETKRRTTSSSDQILDSPIPQQRQRVSATKKVGERQRQAAASPSLLTTSPDSYYNNSAPNLSWQPPPKGRSSPSVGTSPDKLKSPTRPTSSPGDLLPWQKKGRMSPVTSPVATMSSPRRMFPVTSPVAANSSSRQQQDKSSQLTESTGPADSGEAPPVSWQRKDKMRSNSPSTSIQSPRDVVAVQSARDTAESGQQKQQVASWQRKGRTSPGTNSLQSPRQVVQSASSADSESGQVSSWQRKGRTSPVTTSLQSPRQVVQSPNSGDSESGQEQQLSWQRKGRKSPVVSSPATANPSLARDVRSAASGDSADTDSARRWGQGRLSPVPNSTPVSTNSPVSTKRYSLPSPQMKPTPKEEGSRPPTSSLPPARPPISPPQVFPDKSKVEEKAAVHPEKSQLRKVVSASQSSPSMPQQDKSANPENEKSQLRRVSTLTDKSQIPKPDDEMKRTTDAAVKGWSTFGSRKVKPVAAEARDSVDMESVSKVDEYLASRNAHKLSTLSSLGSSLPASRASSLASDRDLSRESSIHSTTEESESDDESESDLEGEDDDSFMDDHDAPNWSVRVCVVSAVDFPASVVPNLPFSPVVKVGLVKKPTHEENPQGDDDNSKKTDDKQISQELVSMIERLGLYSVPKARVRSTSSKILSKRDNGSVEFHEELRWDNVKYPQDMALAIELSARAVMKPANFKESPPSQKVRPLQLGSPHNSIGRGAQDKSSQGDAGRAGLSSLFRRSSTQGGTAEMETANAAAAVAKLLVEGEGQESSKDEEEGKGPLFDSKPTNLKALGANQSEMDVRLRPRKRRKKTRMTDDLRIGSQVVPLTKLPLDKALKGKEAARIEQWFELESTNGSISPAKSTVSSKGSRRNPSILLEISFASPDTMDDSEDEMDEEETLDPDALLRASFSKRASMKIRNQLKQEDVPVQEKAKEPVLEPGVVDYICVVGARDIGDQKSDDGSSGWVNSTPECCVLEQFPPNDDFHAGNGRMVTLMEKVEWFCFPEGCKLWRGVTPPNADELNLNRFSASSPASIASSFASFDACLGCTTSFAWFVIASNSDEYGSDFVKTYGACIRFYVPAPVGIDPTQDDFAQTLMGMQASETNVANRKRLWVPMGICLTSSLPIVGAMEVMLLRLCEELSTKDICMSDPAKNSLKEIYEDLASLIINFQKPIRGVVHCSLPFLTGERLHITLPPRTGLPALPHGNSVTSVCRLLGADGINYLLAAMLTECKVLIHSDDVANLCLVSEVFTALIYPFTWSLPYIPVLPAEMMEFIEAPLSYLLGVPSCNIKLVDPALLEDVVVVDLDRDFSTSDYYEGQRSGIKCKSPTPLPATVASNISKAVYRLLRAEEEVEAYGSSTFPGARTFPRMEPESLAEREFRIAMALEVSSLLRGYQECLVYASSSQPVFNVDKFLQLAPALFEEQRGTAVLGGQGADEVGSRKVLSPRSRRFMSILVNCQNFHQFLEVLETDQISFFHEIMGVLNEASASKKDPMSIDRVLSKDFGKTVDHLSKSLQQLEDKIPTYRIKRSVKNTKPETDNNNEDSGADQTATTRFPVDLLQPIVIADGSQLGSDSSDQAEGVKHISLEYLVELEKNPWRYQDLFGIELGEKTGESVIPIADKVKLRDAIGERRYRTWKLSLDQERFDTEEASLFSGDSRDRDGTMSLDLGSLLTSSTDEMTLTSSDSGSIDSRQDAGQNNSQKRLSDAKDRDVLRRCLEKANVSGSSGTQSLTEKGRDLVSEAEVALRNPSARRFLLSVLNKRSGVENKKEEDTKVRRRASQSGSSKLDTSAFDVLLRLGCAMLDACMESKEYDSVYSLLKLTAGLYTTLGDGDSSTVVYMTGRMGLHPIYADLGVWERVKDIHLSARHEENEGSGEADEENDEYEAAVATLYEMLGYGIPAEELARFASRIAEENGWFGSDRGQSLLLLARRLCVRRDQGEESWNPTKTSDIEMMSPRATNKSFTQSPEKAQRHGNLPPPPPPSLSPDEEIVWTEIGWCHPAAQSSRRLGADKGRRAGTQSLLNKLEDQKFPNIGRHSSNYMKRTAVTSLAYLGSSVVVTGGLDGGVFMARRVDPTLVSEDIEEDSGVRGIHLDWGSSGSRYSVGSVTTSLDGEYGVGAVSCLAATRGANSTYQSLNAGLRTPKKDVMDALDEEDLLEAMEGCRVVAGTTCGDLRVWSVKDVFSAVFYASRSGEPGTPTQTEARMHRGAEGTSSSLVSQRRKTATDFAAGSSLTRLKFSLRGRALSGHRGGVSCIDVPSNVYRPDSIVSGGADGLIKLWSLRAPGSGRRPDVDPASSQLMKSATGDTLSPRTKAARSGDALSILSGHGGRILCVKTAWHGDRLLSGGADRTVRVWDLAGSGGKCLQSLSGHFGWVTSVQYWGPNTIISASTDRSIALWDARVRNSPLFTLRHHYAPVSDLLVGSRTDPIMISSASDGTVAAWDFRQLSGKDEDVKESGQKVRKCKVVRYPAAKLYVHDYSPRRHVFGPVLLSRGIDVFGRKTIQCLGSDAIVREWDYQTGSVLSEHVTGHCDTVSSFSALQGDKLMDTQLESTGNDSVTGTITTSWDGTVRMRTLVRK